MIRSYKCLSKQEYRYENYTLIPVRNEDKYLIMKWRNEQINILRQKHTLREEEQDHYFANVVNGLFKKAKPEQILFSLFEKGILIGYGGLVHIDWESRNAEISFVLESQRNADVDVFKLDFFNFLIIIKEIAFESLKFIKIHTSVYDIRPYYIEVVEMMQFICEGRLREHILINGKFNDLLIYSLFK